MVLGELVTFQNKTGFQHDGIVYKSTKGRTTVIHIHGSYGNFYQQKFLRTFATHFVAKNINLLAFNLTCHDGFGDAYYNNDDGIGYSGGALSDFETCLNDIEAAITFAMSFSDRIILQGHSLGCDRIVHYLLKTQAKFDFVLLAPCDSYKLQVNYIKPETISQQRKRLLQQYKPGSPYLWLPLEEYGVRQGATATYPNPITLDALLSVIDGPPFYLFRIENPVDYWINQNSFIYIGGSDALQTSSSSEMLEFFRNRFQHVTLVNPQGGDHSLTNCDTLVADQIINWIHGLGIGE